MKQNSPKSIIIAYAFATVILLTNMPLIFAHNLSNKNEVQATKTDTLYIKSTESIQENNNKEKKTETLKSTSKLSYNIVYYLISKIVQLTTITRSR